MRSYYLKHLGEFGAVYLNAPQKWRDLDCFSEFKYYRNDKDYEDLKGYACRGDIISTLGDINDLTFLNGTNISVLDTSNVSEYCFLNFKVREGEHFQPRVIWTDGFDEKNFAYRSYSYEPLTVEQAKEFDRLFSMIKSCVFPKKDYPYGDEYAVWLTCQQHRLCLNLNETEASIGAIYSKETLGHLKEYCDENIFQFQGLILNMQNEADIGKLNAFSAQEIKTLSRDEGIQRFTFQIVKAWRSLNADVYLAFFGLNNWKEAFENYINDDSDDLPLFLKKMSEENSLDHFLFAFDEDRLIGLIHSIPWLIQPCSKYLG